MLARTLAHRAERCPGGASHWSGVYPSRELAIQQLFTLSIDWFRAVFLPCANPRVPVTETMTWDLFETQPDTPNSLQVWRKTYHIWLGLGLDPVGSVLSAVSPTAQVNRETLTGHESQRPAAPARRCLRLLPASANATGPRRRGSARHRGLPRRRAAARCAASASASSRTTAGSTARARRTSTSSRGTRT